MKSHDNLVSNEDQKNMKKIGDNPLPENVYSLDSDESETLCFSEVHGARRDGGKTTTPEPLILLEFKHFYELFSFSKNSENYHQKDLKSSIRIKVVI